MSFSLSEYTKIDVASDPTGELTALTIAGFKGAASGKRGREGK